jgi:hypothetical protein
MVCAMSCQFVQRAMITPHDTPDPSASRKLVGLTTMFHVD